MSASTSDSTATGSVSLIFNEIATDVTAESAAGTISAVALPFDLRQRSRLHIQVSDGPLQGQSVGIDLARGTVLRDGMVLRADGAHLLRITAAFEPTCEVTAGTATDLTRLAYHLGNRHVPVQITDQCLRFVADHVLADMVRGLGGQVTAVDAPFDPESGAYSHRHDGHEHEHGHHHNPHGDRNHAPKIHDLSGDQ